MPPYSTAEFPHFPTWRYPHEFEDPPAGKAKRANKMSRSARSLLVALGYLA